MPPRVARLDPPPSEAQRRRRGTFLPWLWSIASLRPNPLPPTVEEEPYQTSSEARTTRRRTRGEERRVAKRDEPRPWDANERKEGGPRLRGGRSRSGGRNARASTVKGAPHAAPFEWVRGRVSAWSTTSRRSVGEERSDANPRRIPSQDGRLRSRRTAGSSPDPRSDDLQRSDGSVPCPNREGPDGGLSSTDERGDVGSPRRRPRDRVREDGIAHVPRSTSATSDPGRTPNEPDRSGAVLLPVAGTVSSRAMRDGSLGGSGKTGRRCLDRPPPFLPRRSKEAGKGEGTCGREGTALLSDSLLPSGAPSHLPYLFPTRPLGPSEGSPSEPDDTLLKR